MTGMEQITQVHSDFGFLGDDTAPKERQRHTMANINIHNSIMEEEGGPDNHENIRKYLDMKSPDSFEYNLDTSIQRTDLFVEQGRTSPVTKTEITSQGGFIAMKELEKNLNPKVNQNNKKVVSELFPADKPKFNISTIKSLILQKEKFSYEGIYDAANRIKHVKDKLKAIDSEHIKADLVKILGLDEKVLNV